MNTQVYPLRVRFMDPSTGRFSTLDPYAGNPRDPQGLHKYLYTPNDPINFVDPSGMFSIGNLAATIFGVGTVLGMAYGMVNAGVGLATGQMDFQSAVRTFSKSTLLAGTAAAGAALFVLQAKLFSFKGATTLYVTEVAGGGVALWQAGGPSGLGQGFIHAFYQNPNETIRTYKNEIKIAAESEGVPAELVAAVLLAELNDYGASDLFGDDAVLWKPEEHSIGIAQLRIDNVRNWNLWIPEFGAARGAAIPAYKIRAALETDQSSIELLAQAIRFFGNNGTTQNYPTLGLTAGQPINFAAWDALPLDTRAKIAWLFGGAKDDVQGRLTSSHVLLQADVTYLQVINKGLLQ